jgi:hypothetical protein
MGLYLSQENSDMGVLPRPESEEKRILKVTLVMENKLRGASSMQHHKLVLLLQIRR